MFQLGVCSSTGPSGAYTKPAEGAGEHLKSLKCINCLKYLPKMEINFHENEEMKMFLKTILQENLFFIST
jgi:hypothetical protein